MGMTKYPFPVRVFPLLHPGRFTRWVPSYCQCGEKRIGHMVNVGSRSERETRAHHRGHGLHQGYRRLFHCLLESLTGSILSPVPWMGKTATEEVEEISKPWRR